jgi:hypothetical protein
MYWVGPESNRAALPGNVEKIRKVPINVNALRKSKTDGITRLYAASMAHNSEADELSTWQGSTIHPATPSCASDSLNCIHHWIQLLYFPALCAFFRNCQYIFIKCWYRSEFFLYISRCHFACWTQAELVFVAEIKRSGFLKLCLF